MTGKLPTSLWKRTLLFAVLAISAILALIILSAVGVSLWGRWEWQKTKRELEARGEKLSFKDFVPPPVPDNENFYGDQVWLELTDMIPVNAEGKIWLMPQLTREELRLSKLAPPLTKEEITLVKTHYPGVDYSSSRSTVAWQIFYKFTASGPEEESRAVATFVLQLLAPCAPMVEHFRELSKRPFARFSTDYTKGLAAPLRHVPYLMRCSSILALRAEADLLLGNSDAAFQDVALLLRLQHVLEAEPLLIPLLVRLSIIGNSLSDIDDGIKTHQWRSEELMDFESELAKLHLIQDSATVLRSERAGFNSTLESNIQSGDYGVLAALNKGVMAYQQNLAFYQAWWRLYIMLFVRFDTSFYNRVLQREIDHFDETARSEFFTDDRNYMADLQTAKEETFKSLPHFLSFSALSLDFAAQRRIIMVQDQLVQTRIACALELFKLKNGFYPGNLSKLVPEFISEIPKDVLTGQSMIYHQTASDKFLLYSVGWDRTDDEGKPIAIGQASGDWVWGTRIK